jgi:hypothetical protein
VGEALMDAAEAWMNVARTNHHDAGRLMRGESWRSSISRSYYCAYSAAHAIVTHLDASLSSRGNLSHRRLPLVLRSVLIRSLGASIKRRRAMMYQQGLLDAYGLRLSADYVPMMTIGRQEAKVA